MNLKLLSLGVAGAALLSACATSTPVNEPAPVSVATPPPVVETVEEEAKTGLSNIQVVEASGGYSAWLVSEPAIPIVSINMAWSGGETSDPEGLTGATGLMTYMMNEGAGELDSNAYATRMEELNMSFGCTSGDDWTSCSMSTLSENFEEAMDMVRMGLTETRFDAAPFERSIEETLIALQRAETNPGTLARRALYETIYPEGHPYARYATPDTVQAVTIDDLRTQRDNIMVQDTLLITAVGDISEERLLAAMESTFSGLPESGTTAVVEDVVLLDAPAEPIVRDLPQPQSLVAFTAPGVDRDDPDFFAAYVANYILGGGGFSARLMDEIREKRGLTYGIYTSLSSQDHLSRWSGSSQTMNERAGELIGRTQAELYRLATEGPTEAELEDAKSYLTGAYPLGFDSNAKIAGQMMGVRQDELGIDYFERRNELVNAVTIEEVRSVAAEYLMPENFTFVVVGQPEELDMIGEYFQDSLAPSAEEEAAE